VPYLIGKAPTLHHDCDRDFILKLSQGTFQPGFQIVLLQQNMPWTKILACIMFLNQQRGRKKPFLYLASRCIVLSITGKRSWETQRDAGRGWTGSRALKVCKVVKKHSSSTYHMGTRLHACTGKVTKIVEETMAGGLFSMMLCVMCECTYLRGFSMQE